MNGQVQTSGYEIQLREEINLLSQCQCTKCSDAVLLGRKVLTISCSGTSQKKLLAEDLDEVLKFMRSVLSVCNQANAMQDVDTPGSLDSHHPTTLSMAPPEPPSFSQTAESGTSSSLPETGDPPEKSVPRQLSPRFQPLSQSHSERADSGRTTPSILPTKIEAQLGPQNCSTSMESGDFIHYSPGFKSPSQAMRAMKALFDRIQNKSFSTMKPPKFTSSSYTKEDVQCALASTPSAEVAFEVVADVTKNMNKGRDRISPQDELLFFCLCKVLQSIGVDDRRLRDLRLNGSYYPSFKWDFVGVVWANQLLEEMFEPEWGHDAVDLLLSCKSKSCRCMNEPR